MKIILCVKQVPDTSDIKWTENNTINRDGLESITNPFDVYALDAALLLKSFCKNVSISLLSMGPMQASRMLRKMIACGADDAILLSDKKFAGADTYATGKTIASAISSNFENYDLVICGQCAIDGGTAQTGPSIANFLGVPHITFVKRIIDCDEKTVTLERELDEGIERIEVKLPAVICMLKSDKEPSRATINGVINSQKAKIKVLGIDEIKLSADEAGLKGSPTYVNKAFRAAKKNRECKIFEDITQLADVISSQGGCDE